MPRFVAVVLFGGDHFTDRANKYVHALRLKPGLSYVYATSESTLDPRCAHPAAMPLDCFGVTPLRRLSPLWNLFTLAPHTLS
jgi:hypothetical protein